jgi:hypothetical protein
MDGAQEILQVFAQQPVIPKAPWEALPLTVTRGRAWGGLRATSCETAEFALIVARAGLRLGLAGEYALLTSEGQLVSRLVKGMEAGS